MWLNLTADEVKALEVVLSLAELGQEEYEIGDSPEIAIVRAALEAGRDGAWEPLEDGDWFWSEMDKTVLDISSNGKTISIDDGEHRLSKTFKGNVNIRLCRKETEANDDK